MNAIFHKPFEYDRRPKQNVAWSIQASPEPQSFPRDVIEAAVDAGKATLVEKVSRRGKSTD